MDEMSIIRMIELCRDNYDEKTFNHAVRVANFAIKNPFVDTFTQEDIYKLYILAMAHDLIEDTDVTYEQIADCSDISRGLVNDVLSVLTKEPEQDYIEYIRKLRNECDIYSYIIKLADMKDHLMQKDTLTDKLKEKYWNALPELL